jgi:integrase/recombinase XerC
MPAPRILAYLSPADADELEARLVEHAAAHEAADRSPRSGIPAWRAAMADAALAAWTQARGREPGPLFLNFDRARKGDRLTGCSINRIVKGHGLGHAHGLRHGGITEALDLTGGNVRAVQRFSRHRDVRVLNLYDDNRADLAGEVARLVAAGAQ